MIGFEDSSGYPDGRAVPSRYLSSGPLGPITPTGGKLVVRNPNNINYSICIMDGTLLGINEDTIDYQITKDYTINFDTSNPLMCHSDLSGHTSEKIRCEKGNIYYLWYAETSSLNGTYYTGELVAFTYDYTTITINLP